MLARTVSRRALGSRLASPATRRLLSTTTAAAAPKKGSWKGTAFRWGLAGAGLYYYNTNDIFAEQEEEAIDRLEESIHQIQQSELPTIEAVVAAKRARASARAAEEKARAAAAAALPTPEASEVDVEADTNSTIADLTDAPADSESEGEEGEEHQGGGMQGLEAEAGQEGAFNPETGEINWDCPCLGGMAHGPCGDEFREAFSCFVYSKEEPKGMECIDKFKGMQDCFRAHPEMYGSELEDDEEEVEAEIRAQEAAKAEEREGEKQEGEGEGSAVEESEKALPRPDVSAVGEKVVPAAAHDATDAVVTENKA